MLEPIVWECVISYSDNKYIGLCQVIFPVQVRYISHYIPTFSGLEYVEDHSLLSSYIAKG